MYPLYCWSFPQEVAALPYRFPQPRCVSVGVRWDVAALATERCYWTRLGAKKPTSPPCLRGGDPCPHLFLSPPRDQWATSWSRWFLSEPEDQGLAARWCVPLWNSTHLPGLDRQKQTLKKKQSRAGLGDMSGNLKQARVIGTFQRRVLQLTPQQTPRSLANI